MSERDCTCLGSCKGAAGLAPGWRCALVKDAPPVSRAAVSELYRDASDQPRICPTCYGREDDNVQCPNPIHAPHEESRRRIAAARALSSARPPASAREAIGADAFAMSPEWGAKRDAILRFCNPRDGEHWRRALYDLSHEAALCALLAAPARPPSGAGSPVAHRWERCSECGPMVICGHCGNNCCNGGSGDNCPDRCASAYAEQKAGWARLNASKAWHPAPPAAGREPSEALSDDEEREFVDAVGRECDVRRDVEAKLRKELAAMNLDPHALDEIGFEWVVQQAVRAGATFGLAEAERGLNVERVASLLYAFDEGHGGREPAKAWENVGTVWQDGWRKRARTLLRAALGASAQRNTGEGR